VMKDVFHPLDREVLSELDAKILTLHFHLMLQPSVFSTRVALDSATGWHKACIVMWPR